jgi:hypothetical protein
VRAGRRRRREVHELAGERRPALLLGSDAVIECSRVRTD